MAQIAPTDRAFAVIDCETTGFHPNAHHRIVELAIASVNDRGELDERDAPSFDEILGEVLDRLAGRVVVAHNARFDCAFLEHELTRSGVDVVPLPSLCTMELAGHLGLGGSRMRLVDCCAAIGATPLDTHTAEADALACATLLAAYLSSANSKDIDSLIRGQIRLAESWPRSDERAPRKGRDRSQDVASEPSFLARLVQTADAPLGMDTAQVAP